jgi:hypothetical protein
MSRCAVALLCAALVTGGCTVSSANEPPPRHAKPSSNQNPDTESR